jgi:inner membrane protein
VHKEGHVGAALLAYTPLGAGAVLAGAEGLALFGAVASVALASLPDYDLRLPFVSHRGITHTVWFAVAVGAVLGGAGFWLASQTATAAAPAVAAFAALVGVTAVVSHVAADAITPMGVTPLTPLSGWHYSASLVRADNTLANYLLLALGVMIAAGTTVLLARFGV